MKTIGKRIGIDLDGCVSDYQTYFLEKFNERFETKYTVNDWTSYNFTPIVKRHQFTEQDFWNMIKEHAENGAWRHLSPIKGSIEGLKEIRKNNSIHIISYKLGNSKEDAVHWLEKYKVDYDTISFSKDKGKMCHILNIDYMIEDAFKHAEDIATYGIETILLDQPWNRIETDNQLIIRVKNWQEIVEILK